MLLLNGNDDQIFRYDDARASHDVVSSERKGFIYCLFDLEVCLVYPLKANAAQFNQLDLFIVSANVPYRLAVVVLMERKVTLGVRVALLNIPRCPGSARSTRCAG